MLEFNWSQVNLIFEGEFMARLGKPVMGDRRGNNSVTQRAAPKVDCPLHTLMIFVCVRQALYGPTVASNMFKPHWCAGDDNFRM